MSSKDRSEVQNLDRRRFMTTVGAAAGSVALAGLACQSAQAAELPKLAETDPLAVSMGYKEDTKKVDGKKHTNHKPNQTCDNCRFYQGTSGDFGPCQIFAAKAVAAKGWCQVWAAK
jgi:hypothetical protein